MSMKKWISVMLLISMVMTLAIAGSPAASAQGYEAADLASNIASANIDTVIYLDYAAGINAGVYKWVLSEDGEYYALAAVDENGEPIKAQETAINVGANNAERGGFGGGMPQLPDGAMPQMPGGMGGRGGKGGMSFGGGGTVYQGVYMNANITNLSNQTMAIYVPAAYMTTDTDGNVTGIDHEAVIGNYTADTAPIVYLNECGGWRSSSPRSCDTSYIEQGMIYVTAGARSRDAKSEDGSMITGKAPTQVVDLKSGVIALRANGDVIPGNKDRIISIGTSGGGQMSSILGAAGNMPAYYEYLYEAGALGVTKNADGSYSSAVPDNVYGAQLYCPIADIEDADLAYAWWWVDLADDGGVCAMVNAGGIDPAASCPDSDTWLIQNDDGSWQITDLRGFMIGTGLVNKRSKAIPDFDPMDKSTENDAFGAPEQGAVHYSASVAQILSDHYEELSALDGFNKEYIDSYIEEALTGKRAEAIARQANLLNAAEILLGYDGLSADAIYRIIKQIWLYSS